MNMKSRFLQTPFWAEFKAAHGWKTLYFFSSSDGSITPLTEEESVQYAKNGTLSEYEERTIISLLTRSFSLAKVKRFSLAYLPMIPEFCKGTSAEEVAEKINALGEKLKPYLPSDCLFIRFDPAIDFFTPEERDTFTEKVEAFSKEKKLTLKKAPVAVQPPDTTILDLTKTEEELLSAMKNKWRYNIRLASKKGVTVTKHFATDYDFEDKFNRFYDLFCQTSERDGVSFHGKDYYVDLLKRSAAVSDKKEMPKVTLYLAEHEEDYLAGIITLFCGREAVYLYGASGNIKRNLMPAYLLQWTAIQEAKAYGSPCYDFYGMPPTADENHPMHGLYLFKTGFGGQNTHRPGSFDFPLKNDYKLYLFAEKLRAFWHKKVLKKIRHR